MASKMASRVFSVAHTAAMPEADMGALMAAYGAFTQALDEAGALVAAHRLQPTNTARTVRVRDGETLARFAPEQGWEQSTTRWQDLAEDPELELVDVARLGERAYRNLAGYGPLTDLLDDDDALALEHPVDAPRDLEDERVVLPPERPDNVDQSGSGRRKAACRVGL